MMRSTPSLYSAPPPGTPAGGEPLAGPKILMLIGPSLAGKSTLAGEFARRYGFGVVYRDLVRAGMTGHIADISIEGCVARACIDACLAHIEGGRGVVYDAPNLSRAVRAPVLEAAAHFEIPIDAIVLETPLDELLRRNQASGAPLDPDILRTQLAMLEVPQAGDEPFARVTTLHRSLDSLRLEPARRAA